MERCKLLIVTNTGGTFIYIVSKSTALRLQEEFSESITTQFTKVLRFASTIDDIDANIIDACWSSEAIVAVDICEIKGL